MSENTEIVRETWGNYTVILFTRPSGKAGYRVYEGSRWVVSGNSHSIQEARDTVSLWLNRRSMR